jgi:hypothetical protein
MSQPKFTNGPWLREGATVYALQHHGWRNGEETFCNRFSFGLQLGPGCTEEELLANAQLAQAAPDLLAVLQGALLELREYEFDASGESYNNPKINAAIAKALGE